MPPPRYRKLFELSRGGMGRVDLAVREEASFSRLCAIKRLRSPTDPHMEAMLREEARLAGLLRHPNAVPVLDVGHDDEGLFLVMDYVDGVSFADLLTHAGKTGALLPVQLCLQITIDVAKGLHAAHELRDAAGNPLGLVHRDVSPPNLLVAAEGVARVTDFGIAKHNGARDMTEFGVLKGKMGYMAPERLRFSPHDLRADLFGLGVVLWELLAGRRLYAGDTEHEVAQRILNEDPPDIALERNGVPDEVVELLFRLLSKDPSLRPASAQHVADLLLDVAMRESLRHGPFDVADYVGNHFGSALHARRQAAHEAVNRGRAKARTSFWAVRALGASVVAAAGFAAWWAMTPRVATPQAPAQPTAADLALLMESAASARPVSLEVPVAADTPIATASAPPLGAPKPRVSRAQLNQPPKVKAAVDCSDPFEFDASGRKRVKRDCFR